ncbi:MAG: hypothetical protein QM674_19880 [Burkholderiaceae bacterium]
MGDHSPGLPYSGYLEHCNAPGIHIRCHDMAGALLDQTEVMPIARLQDITLQLNRADRLPGVTD